MTETQGLVEQRIAARERQLDVLRAQAAEDTPDEDGVERMAALEAEIATLSAQHAEQLESELAELERARSEATARVQAAAEETARCRAALDEADAAAETARRALRAAETGAEAARREASRVGAELAGVNQFLRTHAGTIAGASSLADELEVEPGFERAVAAALADRMRAALADEMGQAHALLDGAGGEGGRVLVVGDRAPGAADGNTPPHPGARRLADLVRGPERAVGVARRILFDAWVVDRLEHVPPAFTGMAVTRDGRVWLAYVRELRQSPQGGEERVLAERNRREALVAETERAAQAEQDALAAVEAAALAASAADATREQAGRALRDADRAQTAAAEDERRAAWVIDQRRSAPQEGAGAVRRAQLEGELAAERRVAERATRERAERAERIALLETKLGEDRALVPAAARLAETLARAAEAIAARVEMLDAELVSDRAAGEGVAERLRECASQEAAIQAALRERGDALTTAEVRAQQVRDQAAEAESELASLAEKLGLEAQAAEQALSAEEAEGLRGRIERLLRRREQLGPVNPLAKAEYEEAIAYVEDLERHRSDLETALRELKALIRDTDRQIRETFEETFAATARNFEQLAEELFPGGRGRLRLVREDTGPRPVLGGEEASTEAEQAEEAAEAEETVSEGDGPDEDLGVEIEITPAGKSMKRLTLLSGGEKSMTALAFLFSVFLARPCPFYILDEVEAALDDLNITRFLNLLERHADHAQFIVVTHQKRTMEAADTLYGVSMGDDGISKVVSRKLPRDTLADPQTAAA